LGICASKAGNRYQKMSKDYTTIEVTDRESFQEFVGLLLADFEKNKD